MKKSSIVGILSLILISGSAAAAAQVSRIGTGSSRCDGKAECDVVDVEIMKNRARADGLRIASHFCRHNGGRVVGDVRYYTVGCGTTEDSKGDLHFCRVRATIQCDID